MPGAPREAGDELRLWGESQDEIQSALATPEDALAQIQELQARLEALAEARDLDHRHFGFILDHPHLIALQRGDAYIYKDAMEEFRAPLGILLYHLLPRAAAGGPYGSLAPPPEQPATTTAGSEMVAPPADGGVTSAPPQAAQNTLTSTVVAVLGVLASLGVLTPQTLRPPSPPPLPLEPAMPMGEPYAPTISRPQVMPPRPTTAQFGDSAPARQAIYDLLFKK